MKVFRATANGECESFEVVLFAESPEEALLNIKSHIAYYSGFAWKEDYFRRLGWQIVELIPDEARILMYRQNSD